MTALDDLTLDEVRALLAPSIAGAAAFDGWSEVAVATAAEDAGIDPAIARLAYPGGPMDMICAWIEHVDSEMERAVPAASLRDLSIRGRIRRLVQFRLDAVTGREEGLRRALAIMAMPQNLKRTARRSWKTADLMWRQAGDLSADFNYYTKRATLSAIYGATLAVFIDDKSEGKAETLAFLDRRLDGIIRFEKAKARMLPDEDNRFSMVRFLGRLRYPAR